MHPRHTAPSVRSRGGCRPFCNICCKQKTSPVSTLGSANVFHWVTQTFPLGHPRFFVGSPKGLRIKSYKKANAADGNLPLRLLLKHLSKEKANCQGDFGGDKIEWAKRKG